MTRLSACCISRELESYSPHRGPLGPADDGCGCSSGVEHNLAKVGVEGSNPFARSKSALYYPEPSTFFRSAIGRRPERIDTKILGSNPFARSKSALNSPEPSTFFRSAVGRRPERIVIDFGFKSLRPLQIGFILPRTLDIFSIRGRTSSKEILGSNPFSRSKSVHFLALSANRTLLIENFLHENEIEPAVEFPADLLQPSRFRKAQFAMKVD
ncbi:MAG: hypothetical protein RLZ07_219 [Pseudomonadota bacterium]